MRCEHGELDRAADEKHVRDGRTGSRMPEEKSVENGQPERPGQCVGDQRQDEIEPPGGDGEKRRGADADDQAHQHAREQHIRRAARCRS